MTDYSHLDKLEVTSESTTKYKLHQITVNGKSPTLILAPATEANKPYFNALLKHSGKSRKQLKDGNISSDLIEENREHDRELYPQCVAKGWFDMVDAKGKEVKFTPQECRDFLGHLPNWLFDNVREEAGNPSNFTEVMDLKVNSGNSQGGSSSN